MKYNDSMFIDAMLGASGIRKGTDAAKVLIMMCQLLEELSDKIDNANNSGYKTPQSS